MSHSPVETSSNGIVGREHERTQTEGFVDDTRVGSRALIIAGDAGIGKTALWRHAVAYARDTGHHVLLTRASEDEMAGALVGLTDLFERVDVEAAALHLEIDPFVRGRAVLDILRRLAAEAPVVLAIDELQWLDAASARALRYAIRRLDTEPVAVIATLRGPAPDRLELAASLPPGRCETLTLGPLTQSALRQLLGRMVAAISPLTLRKVHQVSGGNPLYAIELVRSLAATTGVVGVVDSLPLPDSLQGAIELRLETVKPALFPLLEAVAASGPIGFEEISRYLPGVDLEALLTEADDLDLLVMQENLRVSFRHPLLASAVYGRLSPIRRQALHAELATKTTDPDMQARHIALSMTESDREAADLLEQAAERARLCGASDVAAEFARHSHRLTPPGDVDAANRRALAEVTHLAAAGEASRALRLVDELVASLPPGPARAEALVQRFYVENDDVEQGDAILCQALEDAAGDQCLRGQVLDILGWLRGVYRGDLRGGIACAREAAEIAERCGDDLTTVLAVGHLAHMEALAGSPKPDAMRRAVALADRIGGPRLGGGPKAWLAKQHLWNGELTSASTLFSEVRSAHSATGNTLEQPYRHYDLALLACAAGDMAAARHHVEVGILEAQDSANGDAEGWLLYPQALTEAWLGLPGTESTVARLLAWPGRPGGLMGAARARSAHGLFLLSKGDNAGATQVLVEAVELIDRVGLANPGALPVLPDAIIALAGSGGLDRADGLLRVLDEQAHRLDGPRTRALAWHARGVLELARGDGETAAETLAAAAARFDEMGLLPDAARAVLSRGRALLRAGRRTAAADALYEAHQRFAAIGASLWGGLAAADLERASPGRADSRLTTTESRVAGLVAAGRKNREVGAELFMSVATVEAHLTRIYRKLDVRSRTDLVRMVHEGKVPLGDGAAP